MSKETEIPRALLRRSPLFTDHELEFIANEMHASLSCGATDPLFQRVYDKARGAAVYRRSMKRGIPTAK